MSLYCLKQGADPHSFRLRSLGGGGPSPIAQMVGAGKLIQLLFALNYHVAVVLVGVLMVLYVLFGGMLATTWVQIIKAVLVAVAAFQLYGLYGHEARRLQLQ